MTTPVAAEPSEPTPEPAPNPSPTTNPPIAEATAAENPEDDDDDNQNWEDKDDGLPRSRPGVSTWQDRNPDKPVIHLRTGHQKPLPETRMSKRLKRTKKKEKELNLQANIDLIHKAHNKMAKEIVEKHKVKIDLVLCRLMCRSSFKATRKVNLFNAKVHHLAKRLKDGESLPYPEIKRPVLEDPEFQELTPVEEVAMRAELLEDRRVKGTGARATNAAAATDVRFTIAMIVEEMTALADVDNSL
ncbi:hypothetical protein B0H17DRAFT_1217520 [Mycena rosella]|uniref:Uncharacterized protein n=1 Tax=Mycena rosella TaxID=1033263 RepID=A0AAD7BXV9_MYCRO|nr:hypothetical protein B0H17DRAFT_1217520 [Mycena rosella]